MFRTVICRLLMILVTREAIKPCDWALSARGRSVHRPGGYWSGLLTLGRVGLCPDIEELRVLKTFELGCLHAALLFFGVIAGCR